MRKYIILLLAVLFCVNSTAQQRNKRLTIEVTSVAGDNLEGQAITLMQTDFEVSYGTLTLDAEGCCQLKVYAGAHRLSIDREGFEPLRHDFTIAEDATETRVEVTLTEKTRQPYALQTRVEHDVWTGRNDIVVNWNTEAPAFFDDFESYEPFAIEFGQWTGIDADMEAAAPLIGVYPNRGVMQYAQIINPLTVEPTWWYDYPILRPYDGQQYVGFTRTSSGNANDDWLISPAVSVGVENVLTFMGKAADQFTERFMVYVTEKLDQPTQADFIRIDKGNYETADYRGWRKYTYDLSAYEGREIKFAIRYISDYNRYRSFMLMIDDVYVGQEWPTPNPSPREGSYKARSPQNGNEKFRVLLDGEVVGVTDGYSYTIDDVPAGHHVVGVQALYLQAESEVTTTETDVTATGFAHVVFHVTADSKLSPDGQELSLLSKTTATSYNLTVSNGKVEILSLPYGQYLINLEEGAFEAYQQAIDVTADGTFEIALADHIVTPYNITATTDEESGAITLRWNQELIFTDSFEDYDDFATGTFGEWTTVDLDQQPVYPIALGAATNIVSFPGSGTATNPTAIAPMVFNPWETTPAMLPSDPAIAAPTGDKTIIFFSPQRVKADKWLISPLLSIHENYQLSVKAKGYSSMYPEEMEFCISNGSLQTSDFTVLSQVSPLSSEQWALYSTDLTDYAGQQVRLAIHYTSTDAFLAQVDDFTVGPEDGQGETVDYGNIVRFDIYLDGVKVGECPTPQFVFMSLPYGLHTIGICAIYQNGMSEMAEYEVAGTTTGVSDATRLNNKGQIINNEWYDLQGRRVNGNGNVYVNVKNGVTRKILK